MNLFKKPWQAFKASPPFEKQNGGKKLNPKRQQKAELQVVPDKLKAPTKQSSDAVKPNGKRRPKEMDPVIRFDGNELRAAPRKGGSEAEAWTALHQQLNVKSPEYLVHVAFLII